MANFFKNYGPSAYREKHKDEQGEDLTARINGRQGTKTPDPSSIKSEKPLTKKQKEQQKQYDEQY